MTRDHAILPYGRQSVDDADIAAVTRVLRGDLLTTGPEVAAFEEALRARVGAAHAVVVSSGTAALHLAARALGLGPGDVAVVPSVTFVATANAVRLEGAEVQFADVDPDTGLIGPTHLEQAVGSAQSRATGRVRAVFPVHMNGQSCAMAELSEVASGFDLAVVEDACHALGARAGADPVGSCRHSSFAMFSFHPVKSIAMGEGGALTTADADLAAAVRRLRNHGLERDADRFENADMAFGADGSANPWYYELREPGLNYRASDIHCALGRSQLEKLDRFISRRRALADRYDGLLAAAAPLIRPVPRVPGSRSAFHLYAVLIDFAAAGLDRAAVMRELRARGVGSQVHYIPVHRQPYYRARYGDTPLPGADAYYRRCLSLPLFPAMEDGDVDRVVEALFEAVGIRA